MRIRFTTGETARILGVTERQVKQWFDSHRLTGIIGHAGPNDRLVDRQSLIAFIAEYGFGSPAVSERWGEYDASVPNSVGIVPKGAADEATD